MFDWTRNSLLKFHPDKCYVMWIESSKVQKKRYSIRPKHHKLEYKKEERDIRVVIDDISSFKARIRTKINKANSIMGVI